MSDYIQERLHELLSESASAARERERTTLDRLSAPFEGSFVLFGAGGLGRRTLNGLRSLGIEPLAFADNNPNLWGCEIDGVTVLNPEQAAVEFGGRACFLTTTMCSAIESRTTRQMREQLQSLTQVVTVPVGVLYWKYPEVFLPFYFLEPPHRVIEQRQSVTEAFYLWSDTESRQHYVAQVEARLKLDIEEAAEFINPSHYFADGLFTSRSDEVPADCGAFDGDTIRAYIARAGSDFSFIVAFEPDPRNFARLSAYVASLAESERSRIQLLNTAVGSHEGVVTFEANADESSVVSSTGTSSVVCLALDEYEGPKPTFVKMDIEGGELDALAGMRTLLREVRPVLAVSIYHTIDHLWSVPLFIASVVDNYRFHLVPHNLACWDTVCYAVPVERATPCAS